MQFIIEMIPCLGLAFFELLSLSIQNWFIASLAVADMLIGLVIMPFSLAKELMGFWMFGRLWCEIHGAMDVFLCTSSIMNICLISLDRSPQWFHIYGIWFEKLI